MQAQVGYEGNELADHAAKQGALETHMSIKTDLRISRTEIANMLEKTNLPQMAPKMDNQHRL